jgi:cytochrome c oxidase cbb3-type subunit 3
MGRFHDLKADARAHWRIPAALAGLALVLAAASAVHRHVLIVRLLEADADTVDRGSASFAQRQAAPLYRELCAGCHGARFTGDRPRGIPDLSDDDWLYGSGRATEIERIILYGIRSGNGKGWNLAYMPAYGSAKFRRPAGVDPLTPGDIRDTVEYLRTLEDRPADADAARRGREIYLGRGGCHDCHAPDGRGDTAVGAPNLADGIWLYGDGSRESVFDSIARGHSGSCPAWTRHLEPWQARALAIYVAAAARTAANSRAATNR